MSTRSCARPSSPIAHIVFWTFEEVLRPQTFSMESSHLCRARPVGRETPTGGSLRRRSIALFGLRHRLDTALIDADLARRRYDRSPGIIGQRHATRKPLRPRARFRLAGREHFAAA